MFLSHYFSFPCQYHSTNAPYIFIHLPPTLYNVSLPVLQFPLSVSFHQCSILIHTSTCCCYEKDKWAKPGHLPKSNAIKEIGEHWIEKYFHTIFRFCAG
jgi:hypothetical protein